jgi:hypothetical protein
MKKLFTLATIWLASFSISLAQDIPSNNPQTEEDDFDFDNLDNADNFTVKTFCTQKVPYLSPTQLISVGYEMQGAFRLSTSAPGAIGGSDVTAFRGLRLGFNAPVISRSNFILNLGLTYWDTQATLTNPENVPYGNNLEKGLRSTGVNATIFKPLNDTRFLIFQGSADLNGVYRNLNELAIGKSTTYSATAIYGWKNNENTMFGLGVTRTYRAGQLLHIPVIYYNKTYNAKWGIESIIPARLNVRRSFGTTGSLLFGYEIEGNSFYLGQNPQDSAQDLFLRRGELKPRVTFQRQVSGFIWVAAQAGLRYAYRFEVFNDQNPVTNEVPAFTTTVGNPLYFNISLNLVSP